MKATRSAALAATLMLALSAPAMAASCPMLAAQIDSRLQAQEVSDKERKKVEKLRERGMKYHADGDHAKAEKTLNKALKKLDKS